MKLLLLIISVLMALTIGVAQTPARTIGELRESAEKGDPVACNLLGYRYYLGQGVAADKDSSLLWLARAAEKGYGPAFANLGYLFSEGVFGEGRDSMAVAMLKKGVELNVPEAMVHLGGHYLEGRGVETDSLMAEHLYAMAAQKGLHDAVRRLDHLMKFRSDEIEADTLALAVLGDASAFGRMVPYSREIALEYYLRAALRGHGRSRRIIAEELQFFPDALHKPDMERILRNWYAPDSVPDEVNTSSWWIKDLDS